MQEEKRQEPGGPPPARRGASQPRSRSAPQAVGKSTMLYMINTIEADTAIERILGVGRSSGRRPVFWVAPLTLTVFRYLYGTRVTSPARAMTY